MEAALLRSFTPKAIKDITMPQDGLNFDIHASAGYRAHLVGVMARRAVAGWGEPLPVGACGSAARQVSACKRRFVPGCQLLIAVVSSHSNSVDRTMV